MALQLPWLSEQDLDFPPVELALEEPNGLLAAGGDLSPERLLLAYRRGIFPWYEEHQPILWWSPNPRTVVIPKHYQPNRSLKKLLRRRPFTVTLNSAFSEVIQGCAESTEERPDTWITPEMDSAYNELHRQGYAHSVEVWLQGVLVGGLYGIALGHVFFGESMFSRVSNASKVAFALLCQHLSGAGFTVIDCQIDNPHLQSLGAQDISRREFLELVKAGADLPCDPKFWEGELMLERDQ